MKFGHVKEEEDEFDYLPMPGDIYNDHLAKRVGPVIRIGTPISDLSLNELPSPRGIKDSDMFSKEGNLFENNDTERTVNMEDNSFADETAEWE